MVWKSFTILNCVEIVRRRSSKIHFERFVEEYLAQCGAWEKFSCTINWSPISTRHKPSKLCWRRKLWGHDRWRDQRTHTVIKKKIYEKLCLFSFIGTKPHILYEFHVSIYTISICNELTNYRVKRGLPETFDILPR
jgi:hypothetical protein